MNTPLQSLGSTPGAYLAKLAAGNWPNTSGHEDFAQLKSPEAGKAEAYHQGFVLTLSYLAANPTSRVHSTRLAAAVQAANPQLRYAISETAALSAALSTTGGFKGVPGTAQAYVTRDDGETVWADLEGVWLTKP